MEKRRSGDGIKASVKKKPHIYKWNKVKCKTRAMCQVTVERSGPHGESEATTVYTNKGISSSVSTEVDGSESMGCILSSQDNRVKKNIMCKNILFTQHWKGFSTEAVKLERPFVISHSTRNKRQHTKSSGHRFRSQVRHHFFHTAAEVITKRWRRHQDMYRFEKELDEFTGRAGCG